MTQTSGPFAGNSSLHAQWNPLTPKTPKTTLASRGVTPNSVRSNASNNSYSCEREVLHPLDPGAEPDALLHYDTTDEEEDEDDIEVLKKPLPKTERRLFETRAISRDSTPELDIDRLAISPVDETQPKIGSPKSPVLSPLKTPSVVSDATETDKQPPREPESPEAELSPEPTSSSRQSPEAEISSELARLMHLSSLSSNSLNVDETSRDKPGPSSPSRAQTRTNNSTTPVRISKNDQYIGNFPVGSASPQTTRISIQSPKSPAEIRRNLDRLRRSVQIIHDRQTEQEIHGDYAIREEIAKRSAVSSPVQIGDLKFNEKVDRIIQRIDQWEREEKARRQAEEAARQEAERRRKEAEEAERRRIVEEEERRRQEAAEAERRRREDEQRAQQEAAAAKARQEQEDANRRAQEEERKRAEAAAATTATPTAPAATPLQTQTAQSQIQTPAAAVAVPQSDDPARLSLEARKAGMERIIQNLASMRKHVKADASIQKEFNKIRRALKPRMGQFTGDQKQTIAIRDAILKTIDEAKAAYPTPTIPAADYQLLPLGSTTGDQVPFVFVWIVNELGKMFIDQLEAEASVEAVKANPIGICLVSTLARANNLANGHSFLDIILARLWKHNPIIRGELGPDNSENDLKRLGYRKSAEGNWETHEDYSNRMSGLCAGYAAIASRNFTKTKMINPHPLSNIWFLFAYYCNANPDSLTNTHYFCIKTMLEISIRTMCQIYAQQGIKLVSLLIGAFAEEGIKRGRSGAISLKAMGEIWKTDGLDLEVKKQ